MERLTEHQALELYENLSLHELGRHADDVCRRKHPGPVRTYVIDRNINYTNICTTGCKFCAFSKKTGDAGGYVLTAEQINEKIDELVRCGGTQVLLQGGMNPQLSLDWHVEMIRGIKRNFPDVQIHAFSPPEIWHFHRQAGLTVEQVIGKLVEAGLSSIPGGGAEILVDDVRRQISPRKCSASQWLDVMRLAHRMGLMTTATMMLGHVETRFQRIEHLQLLRELQDESLAAGKGKFTAFICWTFQPSNTAITNLREVGPTQYLRTLAIARIFLDNFENLQSSWVTQGHKIGQLALFYGANDMGGVMLEENVVASAGTSFKMTTSQMQNLISQAGFTPRQRDGFYNLLA